VEPLLSPSALSSSWLLSLSGVSSTRSKSLPMSEEIISRSSSVSGIAVLVLCASASSDPPPPSSPL
jgi:hypothetical protein